MQKYMCIESPLHWAESAASRGLTYPVVGEIVTSIRLETCACGCGEYMLFLVEHKPYGYAVQCFAPLSDIDETELIAEREAVGV